MATIDWGGTDRAMKKRIGQYGEAVKQAAFNLAQYWAPNLESYAKMNRPWTDRTSNARQGLWSKAFTVNDGDTVVIILSHGVYYGRFLELSNAGRYAIIMPTLQAHYGPIWASYRKMLGGR